jgi:hypothetical protein
MVVDCFPFFALAENCLRAPVAWGLAQVPGGSAAVISRLPPFARRQAGSRANRSDFET